MRQVREDDAGVKCSEGGVGDRSTVDRLASNGAGTTLPSLQQEGWLSVGSDASRQAWLVK